jgi:hypothetical protein
VNHLSCVALTLLAGCQLGACRTEDEPCNRFLSQDQRLAVTVVGPAPIDSATPSFVRDLPSCGTPDLQVGSTFSLTLSTRVSFSTGGGGSCYHFECPLDFPGPAQAVESSANTPLLEYVCLNTTSKVQLAESCEVGRYVALYSTHAQPGLFATDAGAAPSYIVLRALTRGETGLVCNDLTQRFPAAATDPQNYLCADQFRVTFQEP